MSCHDVHPYLHDYIEGTLPPEKRQLVETHLKECTDCQGEIPEMKNTIILTQQLDEIDSPPFLASRIMADVREESQKRSTFMQFFMTTIRVPAGALALVTIALISCYLYISFDPVGEKSKHLQTNQTDRSQLPDPRLSPDQSSEALVSHPNQHPEDFNVYEDQPGGNINIHQPRAIMDDRMVDVDVSVAVEDVTVSAKIILKDLLQMDGNIFKAELLEKEYRISAGIKSAKKKELLAKLKKLGAVEQMGGKQSPQEILNVQIRIIENQKSP